MPGIGMIEITRHTPRMISVKMIRDLSSGILKQFANVLVIFLNMTA
jgi:hypothetical protein